MPFLKTLIRQAVQKAAQDPRVRNTAQRVFENEIKPRAKTAWNKAKPGVEAAWEKAKPQVEAAKAKAAQRAVELTQRVKQEVRERRGGKPGES